MKDQMNMSPALQPVAPVLMRQAVASVVSRVGNDLRVGWLRPERCDVGTLLYCASEPVAAVAPSDAKGKADAAIAGVQVLKGIGKIDGDGWKDVTRKGEVVFVWNTELPRPYKAGQFPRIGNRSGWSASTDQYDFQPATSDEAREAIEAIIDSQSPATSAADAKDAALEVTTEMYWAAEAVLEQFHVIDHGNCGADNHRGIVAAIRAAMAAAPSSAAGKEGGDK